FSETSSGSLESSHNFVPDATKLSRGVTVGSSVCQGSTEDSTKPRGRAEAKFSILKWMTLAEVAFHSGYPEASVSARIRDLKNVKKLAYERRKAKDGTLNEYRLLPPPTPCA